MLSPRRVLGLQPRVDLRLLPSVGVPDVPWLPLHFSAFRAGAFPSCPGGSPPHLFSGSCTRGASSFLLFLTRRLSSPRRGGAVLPPGSPARGRSGPGCPDPLQPPLFAAAPSHSLAYFRRVLFCYYSPRSFPGRTRRLESRLWIQVSGNRRLLLRRSGSAARPSVAGGSAPSPHRRRPSRLASLVSCAGSGPATKALERQPGPQSSSSSALRPTPSRTPVSVPPVALEGAASTAAHAAPKWRPPPGSHTFLIVTISDFYF